ncbi:hypothetical protein GQS40_08025|uniref:Bacterial sugar transferase domain-containing protein n=1 Tax=Leuconostoc lactis TaxID=1246 RepID=A0A6L7ABE3_LEULA|nr:hypothetical protein [Leuconostoc lactis]
MSFIGPRPLASTDEKVLALRKKSGADRVRPGRRFLDIIVAITLGIVLIVPLFFVAILVKLTSKGPVFFKQERFGLNSKPFTLYKFRSMTDGAPIKANLQRTVDILKLADAPMLGFIYNDRSRKKNSGNGYGYGYGYGYGETK